MQTRRTFLARSVAAVAGFGLTALPAVAQENSPSRADSRLDKLVPLIEPVLDLYNPNTREREEVRFYGATGYNRTGLAKLNHLLRDWRQDEIVAIDLRLFWGLAAIRTAALRDGLSGEIQANSGYRTRETNDLLRLEGYKTAPNSFHMKGRAVDFKVIGGSVEHVARYAEWLEIGGTGHYRGRFVHADTGEVRRWFG